MAVQFDPNTELNPNPILWAVAILVVAGFATVAVIITASEKKDDAGAATAPK